MSYLPSSPDLTNIAAMLAKYPRRGILLFKLLEDIKSSCSPLNKSMRELIITYFPKFPRTARYWLSPCYVHPWRCLDGW